VKYLEKWYKTQRQKVMYVVSNGDIFNDQNDINADFKGTLLFDVEKPSFSVCD